MVVGIFRRSPARSRRALPFLLATALACSSVLAQQAQAAGLVNGGFEDSVVDAAPSDPWFPGGPNQVRVIDCEDGSEFQVYADTSQGSCTSDGGVTPFRGDQMLRLGVPESPGDQNNNQNDGDTEVSQTFTATGDLLLSMRVWSTEFRRGRDSVTIDVQGPGAPTIEYVDASEAFVPGVDIGIDSCSSLPCTLELDAGRNGDVFDSDWITFRIAGLEDGDYTLTYRLTTGGGDSHPSWVYFDNSNSPPSPAISFGPGDPTQPVDGVVDASGNCTGNNCNPAAALEGDFVVADCGDSVDPEGDPITCDWRAWGGGLNATDSNPLEQLDTQTAVFYFPDSTATTNCNPDDGDDCPIIELTVSDGQVSETLSVHVNLLNAQPIVGAVDLELRAGGPNRTTVCRFADTGIGSYLGDGVNLTAPELTAGSSNQTVGSGTVVETRFEHDAEFASGVAFAEFTAGATPASTLESCTITDKDNGSGSDMFYVTIIDDTIINAREGAGGLPSGGNETADAADARVTTEGACTIDASCVKAGANYLARLGTAEDQDVYVIRNEDGLKFLPNSDVLLNLEVPADYELMVMARLKAGLTAAPFQSTARISAPFFGSALSSAPFYTGAFTQAPFYNTGFNAAPFFGTGLSPVAAPFFTSVYQTAPFFSTGLSPTASPFYGGALSAASFTDRIQFKHLPLHKVGLAVPSADGLSANDIDLTDVATLNIAGLQSDSNLQVVDLSANTGTATEQLMFRATGNVEEYYAVVFGSYGAFSSAEYSLRVEASEPPSQKRLWENTAYCDADDTFSASWTAGGTSPGSGSGAVLILTQKERFQKTHSTYFDNSEGCSDCTGANTWTAFIGAVTGEAPGGATVVSVPGSWYKEFSTDALDGPDSEPCLISARNQLLQKIKDDYIVDPADGEIYDNYQYIVVLGDRGVIPTYSVLDTTLVGNEADYANQVPARPGSWISTAVAEGYNSTYAFLADPSGIDFEGDKLWIEKVPVGVLTGDPATIIAELTPSPATDRTVLTGYEAFADSAQVNADILGGTNISLIDPDGTDPQNAWSAAELRGYYNDGETCVEGANELALVNLQTHMTPNLLWSSQGYAANDLSDVVSSTEPKSCLTANSLTLSLGCHSGMEIPGLQALPAGQGQLDPSRDWVDEPGSMIAPIGYGLGDKFLANRVTEGLLTETIRLATDTTLTPTLTVGQALVQAKQQYLLNFPDFDAHDADALMVLTAFMPPWINFPVPGVAGGLVTTAFASAEATTFAAGCSVLPDDGATLDLTLYQSGGNPPVSDSSVYSCVATDGYGEYYELDPGGASGTYNRPLLPYTYGSVDPASPPPANQPFNDVILVNRDAEPSACPDGSGRLCRVAATFDDFGCLDIDEVAGTCLDWGTTGQAVDQVFSIPETNWSEPPGGDAFSEFQQAELDSCVPNLAPFPLSYVNSVGGLQRQIVRGAQFRCDEEFSTPVAGGVRGLLRRFDSMHLDALQANVGGTPDGIIDRNPPQATLLEFSADPATDDVVARVAAKDTDTGGSGIAEMVLLVYHENYDGLGGGFVESYSSLDLPAYSDGSPINSSPANPVEFNLVNARGKKLAAQICDFDGNCVYKTLKGSLLVAIDIQVISLILNPGELQVFVENFANLEDPTLTLEVCDTSGDCETYFYDSFTCDSPEVACDESGNALITISEGLTPPPGDGFVVTAILRSGSAFGTDTATLFEGCTDDEDDSSLAAADFVACSISSDGTDVFFDVYMNKALVDPDPYPLDSDVQYRLEFPDLGLNLKWFDGTDPDLKGKNAGKRTPKSAFTVERPPACESTGVGVRYVIPLSTFGSSLVRFGFQTQSGVAGEPNEGLPDALPDEGLLEVFPSLLPTPPSCL